MPTRREQVDGSCGRIPSRFLLSLLACMWRPVISLVCNLFHPCNLAVFRHRVGHHPCSGASYYCGQPVLGASAQPGCVEAAWRSPRAGTAPRVSTATAKASRSRTRPHLERSLPPSRRAPDVPTQPSHHVAPRGLSMHAPSAGEFDGTEFMPGDRVPQRRRNPPLGTAPARLLRLLRAALGSAVLPGRGRPVSASPLFLSSNQHG